MWLRVWNLVYSYIKHKTQVLENSSTKVIKIPSTLLIENHKLFAISKDSI